MPLSFPTYKFPELVTAILHEVLNKLVGPKPILVTEGISSFGSVETYQKLKSHLGIPKYNRYQEWLDFIEKNEILESFDNSILEIELE